MLKKVIHYNNITKALKETVQPLKRGQSVTFKSYQIKPDLKSPRKFTGPYMLNVPVTDTVWDESLNEYVEIAFADQQSTSKGDSIAVFRTIKFVAPLGEITLRGGVANDEYMYYYMMLSNFRGDKENRDDKKEAIYFLVNKEEEAKSKHKDRSAKLDALNKAVNMSDEEVRDFVASTGGNDKAAIDVCREYAESWADKDPVDFIKKAEDMSANLKATIKRALDQGVIKFDKEQLLFAWPTGEPIATVSRQQGGDHIKELVEILVSEKKHEKVLPTIKKSLNKK
jgi:hypothetical protein